MLLPQDPPDRSLAYLFRVSRECTFRFGKQQGCFASPFSLPRMCLASRGKLRQRTAKALCRLATR
jgi:hypothetical protein